jgi:hypothetical protein
VVGSSNDAVKAKEMADEMGIMAITRVVDTKEAEERAEKEKLERERAAKRKPIEAAHKALAKLLEALGSKVEFTKESSWETGDTEVISRVDDVRVGVVIEHVYTSGGIWARKTGKRIAKVSINYAHLANYPMNKDGGFNLDKMAARIAEATKDARVAAAAKDKATLEARNAEALANEIKAEFGIERWSSMVEPKHGKLAIHLGGLDADGARKALTALKEAGLIK